MALRTWACSATQSIFGGGSPVLLPRTAISRAQVKLLMLHAATDLRDLRDLRIAPGNRLEKLRGSRKGQYSIRINDQYRVCFLWRSGDAFQVEIVDYH